MEKTAKHTNNNYIYTIGNDNSNNNIRQCDYGDDLSLGNVRKCMFRN